MTTGHIVFFDEIKGYGKIRCSEKPFEELFVHISQIHFTPVLKGTKVKFTVEKNLNHPARLNCMNVEKI